MFSHILTQSSPHDKITIMLLGVLLLLGSAITIGIATQGWIETIPINDNTDVNNSPSAPEKIEPMTKTEPQTGQTTETEIELDVAPDNLPDMTILQAQKDPFKGHDPDVRIDKLLQGTGQIRAIRTNRNFQGVPGGANALTEMNLREAHDLLTKEKFHTLMKHFGTRSADDVQHKN